MIACHAHTSSSLRYDAEEERQTTSKTPAGNNAASVHERHKNGMIDTYLNQHMVRSTITSYCFLFFSPPQPFSRMVRIININILTFLHFNRLAKVQKELSLKYRRVKWCKEFQTHRYKAKITEQIRQACSPTTRFLLCLLSRRMNIKAIAGLTSAPERHFCLPGHIMGTEAGSSMLWRG